MKNALLIGCGNTRGEKIILGCQDAGYKVTNIGQTESKLEKVNNIKVTWKELDITSLHKILHKIDHSIDFIFFNIFSLIINGAFFPGIKAVQITTSIF